VRQARLPAARSRNRSGSSSPAVAPSAVWDHGEPFRFKFRQGIDGQGLNLGNQQIGPCGGAPRPLSGFVNRVMAIILRRASATCMGRGADGSGRRRFTRQPRRWAGDATSLPSSPLPGSSGLRGRRWRAFGHARAGCGGLRSCCLTGLLEVGDPLRCNGPAVLISFPRPFWPSRRPAMWPTACRLRRDVAGCSGGC